MTGYLHLPPLWVMDQFDHRNPSANHVDQHADMTSAADMVWAASISDDIAICFARDGFVSFVYADHAEVGGSGNDHEILADRISLANAHIACLHSAMAIVDQTSSEGDAITHLTAVHSTDSGMSANDPVTRALLSLPPGRQLNPWCIGSHAHVETTWVPFRHPVSREAVKDSVDRLTALAAGGIDRIRRYEMLLHAGVALQEGNYSLALITASALAEHAAVRLWQQQARDIGGGAGGIVANDAFNRLGAGHLLRLLRMSGAVPEALYLDLDRTRCARNKWAHGLEVPAADVVAVSQKAAAWSMAIADGLNFIVWPTLTLGGWTF